MKNTHNEFIGIDELKKQHNKQICLFEEWAVNREWLSFHKSHYDWWAFPFDKPSSYAFAYTIYDEEVNKLKEDKFFIEKYLKGVELLMLSWGWDLKQEKLIDNPDSDQKWQNWPIRLHKCAMSVKLFGFKKEYNSIKKYAEYLMKNKTSFLYNGKDLSESFVEF